MLGQREGIRFFHPDRGLQRAYATAAAMASARNREWAEGTDSLDLLIAATEARAVTKLLRELDLDRGALVLHAGTALVAVHEPGLTPQAKRIVEVVSHRSLERRRNATVVDLFLALAVTPGPARDVLIGLGLDESRLAT